MFPVNLQSPRVSVIIPTYNSVTTLPDCIHSVLTQTRPPEEVLIVDDASRDATAAVCGTFKNRVRYLRHENNRGASAARNTGAASATGDWLAFLDADDAWAPTKLQRQMETLSRDPRTDFCLTAARVWSAYDGCEVVMRWSGSLEPDALRAELLVRNIFTGLCSSILVRRSAFEAVGGFAAGRACEDRRLAIELLGRFKLAWLDEPLIRQRPGPAHWTDPCKHRRAMLRFLLDYDRLYHDLDPSGRLKRRALARINERTGMHYLENGELRTAARHLARAAWLQPTLANPWRVLINACLGRIPAGAKSAR